MARKTQPPLPPRNEIIVQRPMEDIMHDSMIPYSEYVILERALPGSRTALSPFSAASCTPCTSWV